MKCLVCQSPNPAHASQCGTCGSPLQQGPGVPPSVQAGFLLPPGTRLQGGHYSIGKMLGQGGFGITYKGSDIPLRRPVSVKEFFPQGAASRSGAKVIPINATDFALSRTKFLEEARTLARFSHPNIVNVYGSFEENDTAYMAMEFLSGKSLQTIVEERTALPDYEAISYIEKVADALEAVHSTGLLHRDIKPDNIMVTDQGRAVLIDFGTAREFAAGKTRRMTQMLTVGYAPLEQYTQSGRYGPYTDIYALGATLYQLLTGEVPAQAADRANGVVISPPHVLKSAVSRKVSDAVMWALEMQASKRPQSANEFIKALRGQAKTPAPANNTNSQTTVSSLKPLKFKHGQATSIAELLDLCDRYEDEGKEYLFNGWIEQWLATAGEVALAREAKKVTASKPRDAEKIKGLELFLREAAKAAGTDPFPKLTSNPATLDVGVLPIGSSGQGSVRLSNTGRGHAWGEVKLEPSLTGVKVPGSFASSHAALDVVVSTAKLSAGKYSSHLVVQPEGVPTPLRIPIRFQVAPLQLAISPAQLDFGVLPHGSASEFLVDIVVTPKGGSLSGTTSLASPLPGLTISGQLAGAKSTLTVKLDTRPLEAGHRYATEICLSTNAGDFKIPLQAQTALRREVIIGWTLVGAFGGGFLLAGVRYLLSNSGPVMQQWYFSPTEDYESRWAGGLFLVVVLTAVVLLVRRMAWFEKFTNN